MPNSRIYWTENPQINFAYAPEQENDQISSSVEEVQELTHDVAIEANNIVDSNTINDYTQEAVNTLNTELKILQSNQNTDLLKLNSELKQALEHEQKELQDERIQFELEQEAKAKAKIAQEADLKEFAQSDMGIAQEAPAPLNNNLSMSAPNNVAPQAPNVSNMAPNVLENGATTTITNGIPAFANTQANVNLPNGAVDTRVELNVAPQAPNFSNMAPNILENGATTTITNSIPSFANTQANVNLPHTVGYNTTPTTQISNNHNVGHMQNMPNMMNVNTQVANNYQDTNAYLTNQHNYGVIATQDRGNHYAQPQLANNGVQALYTQRAPQTYPQQSMNSQQGFVRGDNRAYNNYYAYNQNVQNPQGMPRFDNNNVVPYPNNAHIANMQAMANNNAQNYIPNQQMNIRQMPQEDTQRPLRPNANVHIMLDGSVPYAEDMKKYLQSKNILVENFGFNFRYLESDIVLIPQMFDWPYMTKYTIRMGPDKQAFWHEFKPVLFTFGLLK